MSLSALPPQAMQNVAESLPLPGDTLQHLITSFKPIEINNGGHVKLYLPSTNADGRITIVVPVKNLNGMTSS